MVHLYRDYDLRPAIVARRMLLFESHLMQELLEEVYGPTQTAVKAWADHQGCLTCAASAPYMEVPKGPRVDLYAVLANQVHYLGTTLTATAAQTVWRERISRMDQRFSDQPEVAASIRQKGWRVATRELSLCTLPVEGEKLSQRHLIAAVERYIATFVQPRRVVKIRWLSRATGRWLDQEVMRTAEATKQVVPDLERRRILAAELFDETVRDTMFPS